MKTETTEFIKEAVARFNTAFDHDKENRDKGIEDLEFLVGDSQWPESAQQERIAANRPMLTINQMPQFVRQVTGDIRRTNPAIDIVAADDEATDDMAEMIAGLIRNIEYQSDAPSIYEGAAESAASCGIGAWRVLYKKNRKGENEAYIEKIANAFSVFWDPLAKDPTRKDARYCFVTDRMGVEEFKEAYPEADAEDFEGSEPDTGSEQWYQDNTVLVADYFYFEDGKVMQTKISGRDLLEEAREFPCDYIPVVAAVGEEINVVDRVVRNSVIRYAKDSQRLYNYGRTTQAEMTALQPKAPYLATPKQIAGHEAYWDNANSATLPYMLYTPDADAGGKPQREMPPVPSSGLMSEIALASDDMKSTTGIYNAALGQQSNETSGVAIKQRQMESDISTSIYVDNLSKSIAQCGRILVSMIPRVYDTTRKVRSMGVDGQSQVVDINVPAGLDGEETVYENSPSVGEYDVRIKTGPSYSTQRQESVDSLMEFARAFPSAAPLVADIIARNMDWEGSDELADRLAKILPEGMVESDEPPTPEKMMQMQAQQMQMQQQQEREQMKVQADQVMLEIETTKAGAEAKEAQADAQKAELEVAEKQMELALKNGSMNAAIQQIVNDAVARALQGVAPMSQPVLTGGL